MQKVCNIIALSLLARTAFAVPALSPFEPLFVPGCTDLQMSLAKSALKEAKQYAEALALWKPNNEYQPAIDMWLGDRSNDRGGYVVGVNFQQRILDTVRRIRGVLVDRKSETGKGTLFLACNEDRNFIKRCAKDPNEVAYETEDIIKNNWYITFCPKFFSFQYTTLDGTMAFARSKTKSPAHMETYNMARAGLLFHEMMHMGKVVTNPKAWDPAYGPAKAYDLARSKDVIETTKNADSWRFAAQAILAQKTLGLKEPPRPKDRPAKGKQRRAADNSDGQSARSEEVAVEA